VDGGRHARRIADLARSAGIRPPSSYCAVVVHDPGPARPGRWAGWLWPGGAPSGWAAPPTTRPLDWEARLPPAG